MSHQGEKRAGVGAVRAAMARRLLWAFQLSLVLLGSPWPVAAHSGAQNVFYEGNIGPYAARVIIRRPDVVPGLSDITVRMLKGDVEQVSVLPLKWDLGKQGAPTPDIAQPVRGEAGMFTAQLWFMEPGSQSVEVELQGAAGQGSVQIPVSVLPTRIETMPPGLGTVLLMLGGLLVVGFLGIVRAGVRESVLVAGEVASRGRRWGARGAVVLAAIVLGGGLYGGAKWWDAERRDYLSNRLYRALPCDVELRHENDQRILRLTFEEPDLRRRSPIVPDHGKLMHLVLVSQPRGDVLAHLHPLKLNRRTFAVALPDIPTGDYELYGEITYETGFAENLVATVTIDEMPPLGNGGTRLDTDPDDSWVSVAGSPAARLADRRRIARLPDGSTVEWLDAAQLVAGQDLSLRFLVRDADGQPVSVEPYMGMLGHVFVRSDDGHLFTHLHPSGSFSMVSQQLFDLRAQGKAPTAVDYRSLDPTCEIPPVEESIEYWLGQKPAGEDHSISFPWQFVDPGSYRLWFQFRAQGGVQTAVFDAEVPPAS